MPFPVDCPGCRTRLMIPDKKLGLILGCPKCQCQFQVPSQAAQGEPSATGTMQGTLPSAVNSGSLAGSAPIANASPASTPDMPLGIAGSGWTATPQAGAGTSPTGSPPLIPRPPSVPTGAAPGTMPTMPSGQIAPSARWRETPLPMDDDVAPSATSVVASLPPGLKFSTSEPAASARTNAPRGPSDQAAAPRFIPMEAASSVQPLAQDGKLPELSLVELQSRGRARSEPKKSHPALLSVALGLSMLLSMWMVLADLGPDSGAPSERETARRKLATYFQNSGAPLEPYQLLLRDAQRAHSRDDDEAEAAFLRRVLSMLRTEARTNSLTDSQVGDKELEQTIAELLRRD